MPGIWQASWLPPLSFYDPFSTEHQNHLCKRWIDFSHFLKRLLIVLRIKSEPFPWPKRPYKLWPLSDIVSHNFPIPHWAPPTVSFLLFKHCSFLFEDPCFCSSLHLECLASSFSYGCLFFCIQVSGQMLSLESGLLTYLPIQSRIAMLSGYFPVGPLCFFFFCNTSLVDIILFIYLFPYLLSFYF